MVTKANNTCIVQAQQNAIIKDVPPEHVLYINRITPAFHKQSSNIKLTMTKTTVTACLERTAVKISSWNLHGKDALAVTCTTKVCETGELCLLR